MRNTDTSRPDKPKPKADKTKPDNAKTEKSKEKGATDDEVLEALLEGLGVEKDNVDITLKYKKTWSDKQKAEADRKLKVLTEAKTKRTKVIRKRSSARKKYFNKNIPKDYDLDHIVDLQLGGKDKIDNISPLDKSVNRSLGSQIRHAIKKYPYETKFGKFIIK